MIEGKEFHGFKPCPDKSNCVISQLYPEGESYFTEPIEIVETAERALKKLKGIIKNSGAELKKETGSYLHAEYTSSFFKFVDDVEFYIDENKKLIHLRSASRTGYYDFKANKKRIEDIRFKFHQNDF